MIRQHRMPFGSEVLADGAVRFRLWAPAAAPVRLCLEGCEDEDNLLDLEPRDGGWHELVTERAAHGSLYSYVIGDGPHVPDPASRYQPRDVHGPSQVVDPARHDWRDGGWEGRPWKETVLYELHAGSFTPQGGFCGIIERLDYLKGLGVTAVELMPVADFPGRHNWGYDGVLPYAPDSSYGTPEDFKQLVEAAHARELMVFLDVVYNHFGPDGNYLHLYAPDFFTDRHHTPWGAAINFDGAASRNVRDFFIHNALYWLEEYHLDGLRLDAVHAILDDSSPDILEELAEQVRRGPGADRHVHLVLENDDNQAVYLQRAPAGSPRWYDAQWNDDLHHGLHVLATGEDQGYYLDYVDKPLERLGRSLTQGYAYQGDPSRYRGGEPRGSASAHLPATAFVGFLQNHDQVGNRAMGDRIAGLSPPEAVKALSAVLLLAPGIPLLFMGQEWGETRAFPYFCDYEGELGDNVREGRRREFSRFPEFSDPAARERIPDPNDPRTFETAVLGWTVPDGAGHRQWLDLHRQLLDLRAKVIVPLLDRLDTGAGHFRQPAGRTLVAGWPLAGGGELNLHANLSGEACTSAPEGPRECIYLTHPDNPGLIQKGAWPAWFVAWSLK
jgi:malto-oligosyltrehalose trehalohydrolase